MCFGGAQFRFVFFTSCECPFHSGMLCLLLWCRGICDRGPDASTESCSLCWFSWPRFWIGTAWTLAWKGAAPIGFGWLGGEDRWICWWSPPFVLAVRCSGRDTSIWSTRSCQSRHLGMHLLLYHWNSRLCEPHHRFKDVVGNQLELILVFLARFSRRTNCYKFWTRK